MDDTKLYKKILGLTKAYLRGSAMLKTLEAEEVANTAYLYMKTGKYGLKEDGNPYYAIQYAVNPTLSGNTHVRQESVHLAQYADMFKSLTNRSDTDWTELYDEIDNLPYEQSQAVLGHLRGDDVNKRDLKAGQKAMRDIYGK